MAQEKIDATRRQTNLPNESDKYLSKREELRLAEIELMRHDDLRFAQSFDENVDNPVDKLRPLRLRAQV